MMPIANHSVEQYAPTQCHDRLKSLPIHPVHSAQCHTDRQTDDSMLRTANHTAAKNSLSNVVRYTIHLQCIVVIMQTEMLM